MMNFDEFLEAAKDRVQETIPDAEVKIQQVNKLQGESYTGISVQPEGAAAAVTFNVSPAPRSCRGCYFWKNRKTGCVLKKENCYYLAEAPKRKSPL